MRIFKFIVPLILLLIVAFSTDPPIQEQYNDPGITVQADIIEQSAPVLNIPDPINDRIIVNVDLQTELDPGPIIPEETFIINTEQSHTTYMQSSKQESQVIDNNLSPPPVQLHRVKYLTFLTRWGEQGYFG